MTTENERERASFAFSPRLTVDLAPQPTTPATATDKAQRLPVESAASWRRTCANDSIEKTGAFSHWDDWDAELSASIPSHEEIDTTRVDLERRVHFMCEEPVQFNVEPQVESEVETQVKPQVEFQVEPLVEPQVGQDLAKTAVIALRKREQRLMEQVVQHERKLVDANEIMLMLTTASCVRAAGTSNVIQLQHGEPQVEAHVETQVQPQVEQQVQPQGEMELGQPNVEQPLMKTVIGLSKRVSQVMQQEFQRERELEDAAEMMLMLMAADCVRAAETSTAISTANSNGPQQKIDAFSHWKDEDAEINTSLPSYEEIGSTLVELERRVHFMCGDPAQFDVESEADEASRASVAESTSAAVAEPANTTSPPLVQPRPAQEPTSSPGPSPRPPTPTKQRTWRE